MNPIIEILMIRDGLSYDDAKEVFDEAKAEADAIIESDEENAVHIYIYAPYEQRVKNCVNDLHLSEEEAKKMIRSVDEARDNYHMHYAGFLPSDPKHKTIMIDSSSLGVEGTAEYLVDFIQKKFDLKTYTLN